MIFGFLHRELWRFRVWFGMVFLLELLVLGGASHFGEGRCVASWVCGMLQVRALPPLFSRAYMKDESHGDCAKCADAVLQISGLASAKAGFGGVLV